VRSSRRLETEAARNLEVIWLLCRLRPDFKTIADFRKDNRNAFKAVFRQFVLLCRKLDLFGRELVAVDGTRLKAVNSMDRNFTREKLKRLIQWADERLPTIWPASIKPMARTVRRPAPRRRTWPRRLPF
jgi:Transposase domain (DUF772)